MFFNVIITHEPNPDPGMIGWIESHARPTEPVEVHVWLDLTNPGHFYTLKPMKQIKPIYIFLK